MICKVSHLFYMMHGCGCGRVNLLLSHTHTLTHAHTCTHTYTCTHTCTHTNTEYFHQSHAPTVVSYGTGVCMYNVNVYEYIYICAYTYIYIYVCIYIYIHIFYVRTYVCMYIRVCVCTSPIRSVVHTNLQSFVYTSVLAL